MRLGINSNLVPSLEKAGYKLEPAFGSETTTLVGTGATTLETGITGGSRAPWRQWPSVLSPCEPL